MSTKNKYLLDTSILIENISDKKNSVVDKLEKNNIRRRYHLYHCLIEFRLGLLNTWVGFYLDILATQDVAGAKRRFSQKVGYRPREGSNLILLSALQDELSESLEPGNIPVYLSQIEECISYAQSSLALLSNKMKGSNGGHHLLFPANLKKEDYEEFHRRCKEDYVVELDELFATRKTKLAKVVAHLKGLDLKSKEKKRAESIIKLIELGITNPKKVNAKKTNRRYGDIVIATDMSPAFYLLSKDTSFSLLCGGLGKKFVDYATLK